MHRILLTFAVLHLSTEITSAAVVLLDGNSFSFLRYGPSASETTIIQEYTDFSDTSVIHHADFAQNGFTGSAKAGVSVSLNSSREVQQLTSHLVADGGGRVGRGLSVATEQSLWIEVVGQPSTVTVTFSGSEPVALQGSIYRANYPNPSSLGHNLDFSYPIGYSEMTTLPVGQYIIDISSRSYGGYDIYNQDYENTTEFLFSDVPEPSTWMAGILTALTGICALRRRIHHA